MGVYVVTGGTKGIGESAARALRGWGHRVINVDISGGDINADLGTEEGRQKAISAIWKMCPDGIDGLVSNAGIAGADRFSRVLSVNYFGAVTLAEGLYELLKKKKGNVAVTVSGSIVYSERGKYYVDALLTNCGDEARIGRLVDTFDPMQVINAIYVSTKIALVRWVKRVAPSWAVSGVNINAVAPGAVATTIMGDISAGFDKHIMGLPMPTVYRDEKLMDPVDVGAALAMMVLPQAKGISGALLYCDGGTAAILNPERHV